MKSDAVKRSVPLTMMEKPQGYEAFYLYSEHMRSTEFHCHDFYELYIHVRGGQYFSLDNELYLLKPNQLYIIPPFTASGMAREYSLKKSSRLISVIFSDLSFS